MINFEVCLNGVGVSAIYRVQEPGDQVKLERWQGMVRARAARSDKDDLLGVQGEEVAFFLVPKVMTRLGVTRRIHHGSTTTNTFKKSPCSTKQAIRLGFDKQEDRSYQYFMSTIKQDPWRHYKTTSTELCFDCISFNSMDLYSATRSIEDFEAQQAIKKVDEHLMDEDIEKIVEGDEDSDANNPETEKSAYVMQIDEEVEEESVEDALIRKKGKEELKELMTFEPTSSSTKPKTLRSKHIKGIISRMSMRYGYIFHHMKKSFMPRKDMDALGNMVEETLKLERENTKADIVAMVAEAERKEQECTRATLSSQVSNDVATNIPSQD
ncbi:hypothetical protein Tco_0881036 [Tanacetum coccineum]